MKEKKQVSVMTLVLMGVFTALCFVGATISIPIPIGLGMTKIHLGNVFMLIAGLMLGGTKGGIVSGVGMAISDLLSGAWAVYAPGTFICKFVGGLICGKIAYAKGKKAMDMKYNVIGVLLGIFANMILSCVNSFVVNMLVNEAEFLPSIISAFGDLGVGAINAVISSVVALTFGVALVRLFRKSNKI